MDQKVVVGEWGNKWSTVTRALPQASLTKDVLRLELRLLPSCVLPFVYHAVPCYTAMVIEQGCIDGCMPWRGVLYAMTGADG
jgi:hypothetical protein